MIVEWQDKAEIPYRHTATSESEFVPAAKIGDKIVWVATLPLIKSFQMVVHDMGGFYAGNSIRGCSKSADRYIPIGGLVSEE